MIFYLPKAPLSLLLKCDVSSVLQEFFIHEEKFYLQHEVIFIHEADNILFSFSYLSHLASGVDRQREALIDKGE